MVITHLVFSVKIIYYCLM